LQIVAKALVTGFISVLVALAATSPSASWGLAAEELMSARNACQDVKNGATEAIMGGAQRTFSVGSPFGVNLTISAGTATCEVGPAEYKIELPAPSTEHVFLISGTANVTAALVDGRLAWW
jgi:hypothetical protein